MTELSQNAQLDRWVDTHFDEEVRFLQALVQVPTDTPPGNNAPHAERTAELLHGFGFEAEQHPVPAAAVEAYGLQSITNLIVRRHYGPGKTIALNAHGDVVPPGDGWTHDPSGGDQQVWLCQPLLEQPAGAEFTAKLFVVGEVQLDAALEGNAQ